MAGTSFLHARKRGPPRRDTVSSLSWRRRPEACSHLACSLDPRLRGIADGRIVQSTACCEPLPSSAPPPDRALGVGVGTVSDVVRAVVEVRRGEPQGIRS